MAEKLSDEAGRLLLAIARENIAVEFRKKRDKSVLPKTDLTDVLCENRGTFVSLHKKGDLRGCIGNIRPVKTIIEGVIDNAKHAAFNDSRFSPLSCEELEDTTIEVSILTRPEEIEYTDTADLMSKIRPGIDGVIIEKNYQSATFLPQVWQQLKDPGQFLDQLCLKAGLPQKEWKSGDLIVSTYQVQVFEEKEG